jgi:hypothetical protein
MTGEPKNRSEHKCEPDEYELGSVAMSATYCDFSSLRRTLEAQGRHFRMATREEQRESWAWDVTTSSALRASLTQQYFCIDGPNLGGGRRRSLKSRASLPLRPPRSI